MINLAQKIKNSPPGMTHIFSVGQAGYIIKSSHGQLLGIDLYLSNCVEAAEGHDGFKRLLPTILDARELIFDVLIATHPHLDHLDIISVPRFMEQEQTRLFASVECKEMLQVHHVSQERCTYVKPTDIYEEGDFQIRVVDCDHGQGAPDAVGVIVCVDGRKILEVGDSSLRLDFLQQYLQAGEIDLLIAPINGAYGNMNELECVVLAKAVQPKMTIPCHYGMFASHGGNPDIFRNAMNEEKLNYLLMCQGEQYTVSTNDEVE